MSTEVEARAREMGWVPKEQFKLNPDRWVDAQTYVDRGEEILPVLRSNNRKLTDEVVSLRTQLRETQAAIEDLKNFNTEIAKTNAKAREKELLSQISEARSAGNTEVEIELTNQLTDLKAEIKTAASKPVVKPVSTETPQLTPEMKTWMGENPWFGTDKRKTGYAFGVAEELKANGLTPGTKPFYDAMDTELAKQFNPNPRRREPSKVEGGSSNSGSSGDPDAKTFADLPQDAKDACEKQAAKFVGKTFKTLADWRAHYVKKYFE